MENTTKKINSLHYYACGYCVNDLGKMFKGYKKQKRDFHAGVFLVHHEDKGYILFDTGYSTDIYKTGIKGKLYNALNPVFVKEEDHIDQQLLQDGIKVEDVKYIILSHLHPDHIGGLQFFPNATFIVSKTTYEGYKKSKVRDLIFKQFLPQDFDDRLEIIELETSNEIFKNRYDLFNDGSMILTELDGHTEGQMCLYMPYIETFLVADAIWGIDLLEDSFKMKTAPKKIQKSYTKYIESLLLIKDLVHKGIKVIATHDINLEKEIYIKDE